jgi:hypothetical protein
LGAEGKVLGSARPVAQQPLARQDIERVIHKCLHDRDEDGQFVNDLVRGAEHQSQDEIDELNESLGDFLTASLHIHDLIRELMALAGEDGVQVAREHKVALDKASEDYRRWQEDLPERLVMAYGPVKDVIRDRIKEALRDDSPGADWQQYFKV